MIGNIVFFISSEFDYQLTNNILLHLMIIDVSPVILSEVVNSGYIMLSLSKRLVQLPLGFTTSRTLLLSVHITQPFTTHFSCG